MACQMEEPGRVVRIPKIYQDFCHYSLAEDFKIYQIRKTNERFFFKIFIKIDTKPNIKGEINLTNLDIHSLGIFQPVRVDVQIQSVVTRWSKVIRNLYNVIQMFKGNIMNKSSYLKKHQYMVKLKRFLRFNQWLIEYKIHMRCSNKEK